MNSQVNYDDYNEEPVKYCAKCYSLKIKYEDSLDSECCAECGCTDILEANIAEWEKKYERRYGHKLTQKNTDAQDSYFFQIGIKELMDKVSKHVEWKDVIKYFYPQFPKGYGKADSIVLFFDTLIKQNRLNELRLYLFKNFKF